MYDRPFQWGSKRTGPDLARVGGKYSNEWHLQHFIDPRSVVPESVMPPYGFLLRPLRTDDITSHLRALQRLGVPYTDAMIANAAADLRAQADPDADHSGLLERYPKAPTGAFDGIPGRVTEMDAIIAYMQMLGTLVNFADVTPETVRQ
jgi:cytochrome c oxidase cbb3-type subunit 2